MGCVYCLAKFYPSPGVDVASQYGVARPSFATSEGNQIFPDEPWWLTDVQRLSNEEVEQNGDEDGPASDANESGPADDDLTDDDDPSSDEHAERPAHEPELGWQLSGTKRAIKGRPILPLIHKRARGCQKQPGDTPTNIDTYEESCYTEEGMQLDTPPDTFEHFLQPTPRKRFKALDHGGQGSSKQGLSEYNGYFELQCEALCGMHALNNAIGRALHTPDSMSHACDVYVETACHEGFVEERAEHEKPNGWYSSEVLAQAVVTRSLFVAGHVEYVLKLEPLRFNAEALQSSVGAVVNINNDHWVALKWVDDQVWRLDSLKPGPIPMTWQSYVSYIWEHKDAYRIEVAPKPPAAQEA